MADAVSQESSGSDGERRDACSETCPLSRDRRTGSKTTRRSVYSRVTAFRTSLILCCLRQEKRGTLKFLVAMTLE
nr:PREDICTED: uncharacterized protein LOC105661785 isoform X2 [Megachile rotundata]